MGLRHLADARTQAQINRLVANQAQLEAQAQADLGQLAILPWLIRGGIAIMSIVGISAFRQYQETKELSEYLKCIREMEERGVTPGEAAKICSPGGTADGGLDFKTGLIIGGVGLALFLVLRKL